MTAAVSDTPGLDLSSEKFRVYIFPGGHRIRVDNPKTLYVKPPIIGASGGGSHRVVKTDGSAVYISYGWLAIEWTVHEGQPSITF